jgi:hypothetical protein
MFDVNKLDYTSHYKLYTSKEVPWIPGDTIEQYRHNYKNHQEELKKYGWLYKQITYKFNSYGFRCNEFTGLPSVMFLGCSNTLGTGLPLNETWTTLVAKQLELESANLAIGGGSSDSSFRMFLGYVDLIKPKMVIYNQPPIHRVELVTNDSIKNVMIQHNVDYECEYFKEYLCHDTNSEINMYKNLIAIKSLCRNKKIKFHYFDNYMSKSFDPTVEIDLARDLIHYGTSYNESFAKFVLSEI